MSIYPEGHKGGYQLALTHSPTYLSLGTFPCPICMVEFKALKVRNIKLIPIKTGEIRTTYKDIEPSYFEITSCPSCRYSAQTPLFTKFLPSRKKMISEKLIELIPTLSPHKDEITPDCVFERYYLALACYGVGFSDKELLEAGIWLKLSNIYADAGDTEMEIFSARQSQQKYIDAFQRLHIPPMKEPSLNTRIGLLSIKIGEDRVARDFLYKVKIDPNATRLQKDTADDAINELKEKGVQ